MAGVALKSWALRALEYLVVLTAKRPERFPVGYKRLKTRWRDGAVG